VGPKILVVDDSEFMRRMVSNILTRNVFDEIVEATDGLEAVEAFQRDTPDLVLLDLFMPGMDGIEALRRIMDIDEDAKVVILTAMGQEQMRNECLKLGAVDYIVKPFEEEQVVEVLHRLVGYGNG